MAAVTELSFLLFALINNIHAEEVIIIREESGFHTFKLPKDADTCLISRFVGEEKLVLWNTSDLCSQNSTLPEDLKQRLSVFNDSENISFYKINNLTHSDSGLYQEECWTDGKVTHEQNISVIVCSSRARTIKVIGVRLGGTEDLPCYGAANNLDVRWLKSKFIFQQIWTRDFGDNMTSVMDNVKGRYQVVRNTSALRVSNTTITDITDYTCLVMKQQQCVSSNPVRYDLYVEMIYASVEETAVLPCAVPDSTDDRPPDWIKHSPETVLGQEKHTVPSVDQNHSLVFSSLMLNHSGHYRCGRQSYELVVCPKFGPPALELFSEGVDVTLRCKDREKGRLRHWFIKSNQTEGRIFNLLYDRSRLSRVSRNISNGNLVISNVSLKHAGEYWCAVINDQCVSSTRTHLKYIEPFGVHSTFYKVRWSVLSVLLLMLCVVVVAVNQRTRRGEQLAAHTHT